MKQTARSLFMALPLILASSAFAQHQTFTINPDASSVAFALDGFHHVDGSFHVTSGSIEFDAKESKISGLVVVAAGSGNSGDKGRDKKMLTDILDVAHFADVTFAPRSFQGTVAATGDSTIQVTGSFTLHGTPHDLTVPMQLHVEGGNLTAKTQFIVPYVQWGLKAPSFFGAKENGDVTINLTLAGRLSSAN